MLIPSANYVPFSILKDEGILMDDLLCDYLYILFIFPVPKLQVVRRHIFNNFLIQNIQPVISVEYIGDINFLFHISQLGLFHHLRYSNAGSPT